MKLSELIKQLNNIEIEGNGDKTVSLMIETPKGSKNTIQLQFDLNSIAVGVDRVILMHEEWTSTDDDDETKYCGAV
jgi:hypothetical protein